eukprot:gene7066-9051_t
MVDDNILSAFAHKIASMNIQPPNRTQIAMSSTFLSTAIYRFTEEVFADISLDLNQLSRKHLEGSGISGALHNLLVTQRVLEKNFELLWLLHYFNQSCRGDPTNQVEQLKVIQADLATDGGPVLVDQWKNSIIAFFNSTKSTFSPYKETSQYLDRLYSELVDVEVWKVGNVDSFSTPLVNEQRSCPAPPPSPILTSLFRRIRPPPTRNELSAPWSPTTVLNNLYHQLDARYYKQFHSGISPTRTPPGHTSPPEGIPSMVTMALPWIADVDEEDERMEHNVLLLGEGDLSFARALLQIVSALPPTGKENPATRLLCTTLDSRVAVETKYGPGAVIELLVQSPPGVPVEVLFGVDVRNRSTFQDMI